MIEKVLLDKKLSRIVKGVVYLGWEILKTEGKMPEIEDNILKNGGKLFEKYATDQGNSQYNKEDCSTVES